MARISGISTQKNAHGEITHVTFNIKKHKKTIIPLLEQLGVLPKSEFEKRFEDAMAIEQARELSLKHVKETWQK